MSDPYAEFTPAKPPGTGTDDPWAEFKPAGAPAPAPVAAPKPAAPFMERVQAGLMDPIVGAAQIMDKTGIPGMARRALGIDSTLDNYVAGRDAEYVAPEGVDWARMGGNMLNPMSWAGGGVTSYGRAATAGAQHVLPAMLQTAAVRGGANAAAQAALAPVASGEDFWTEKAKQVGTGAAVGSVLSKTMAGFKPTKEAQALMDQGIQPSFGQSMGGWVNRTEEKAASLPGVGDAVSWARNRPLREFEEKVLQRATDGGAKALDAANRHASIMFENAVPHLRPTREVVQNVQAATRDALQNPRINDNGRNTLDGLVSQYFGRFGEMDGPAIKALDSQIGADIRRYAAGDPDHKALADALRSVQRGFREGLESGVPDAYKGALRAANTMWARLVPINKAASTVADEAVRPRALQKALARQQGVDVTRMRPDALVDNAVAVLPNTVPDSGTAGRALLNAATMGAAVPFGGVVPLAAATLGAYGGATRTGQAAMVGNTGLQRALRPYGDNISALMAAALRGELQ